MKKNDIPLFAEMLSLFCKTSGGRLEFEIFHGIDPLRTQIEKENGDQRAVHYIGQKLAVSSRHSLGRGWFVSPLMQGSFWLDDLTKKGTNSIHLLGGIRLMYKKLRIAFNVETIGRRAGISDSSRDFDKALYNLELIYFF